MDNRDKLINRIIEMYFDGVPLKCAISSIKDELREDINRKNKLDKDFELMFKNWSEDN